MIIMFAMASESEFLMLAIYRVTVSSGFISNDFFKSSNEKRPAKRQAKQFIMIPMSLEILKTGCYREFAVFDR